MAKKKKVAAEGEEEAKGSKKKMIIIIVVAVVGLFGAKTMLMKPADPAAAVAAELKKEQDLTALCARQNATEHEEKTETTTTTTVAGAVAPKEIDPHTERGGVLEMDPLTVNLADGHYLKIGIALQLDVATLTAEDAKEEGLGAKALDMAITALSPKTMKQLSELEVREKLKHKLGTDACLAYEGEVLTVYFTNFVMQ